MANVIPGEAVLTSPKSPRIKEAAALQDARTRRRTGHMLLEGRREVVRALAAGCRPRRYFLLDSALANSTGGADPELLQILAQLEEAGAERILVGERAFEKLCYRDRPELPLVVVVDIPATTLEAFRPRPQGPLLVVEDLEKPGNLGAVLRSADGAGSAGVLLVGRFADCGNPNALRSSLGTLFTVPLATSEGAAALSWLRAGGWTLVAATPAGSVDYRRGDYPERTALLLGSEKDGLSQLWLEAADQRVRIPMRGIADSLNLAQSATLLLYEAVRGMPD